VKINVLIYSKSVAKGEKSFDLSTLFSLLNNNSISLSNFAIKEEYDFELTEKSAEKHPLIVLCEKKDMELFEINLSYKFSLEREVENEDFVLLKGGMKVAYISLDGNYFKNIEKFVHSLENDKKVAIFRLFGKTAKYIKRVLSDNNIDLESVKIVENGLLCDIYLSKDKNEDSISEIEQKIGQLFINDIYSESEKSLKDVVVSLMRLYRHKLDIVEPFTCGEIVSCFKNDNDVIYEGLVPISDRALTIEGQMTGFDFQNGGESSVETNTFLCRSRLSKNGADIVIVLTAKAEDGGFREIVSIADPLAVNTIKTFYRGSREEAIKFSVDWVLFNLVKKLRKKDFENK